MIINNFYFRDENLPFLIHKRYILYKHENKNKKKKFNL